MLKPVVYLSKVIRSFNDLTRFKIPAGSVTVTAGKCGLGGRLMTIASARGLASDLNLKGGVNILWNTYYDEGYFQFSDSLEITANDTFVLFEDDARQYPFQAGWFSLDEPWVNLSYRHRLPRAIGCMKFDQRLVFLKGEQLVIEEQEGIDWVSAKPLIYANGLFYANPRIDFIRPKQHIIGWIERIKSWFGERTIGVHIRTSPSDSVNGRRSSEERIIERMKEEVGRDNKVKFFLATDNWLSKSRITCLFRDNIFTQNASFEKHRTGTDGAVVDMFTLSQTEKILASMPSKFSQCAAMLGGIELEVIKS